MVGGMSKVVNEGMEIGFTGDVEVVDDRKIGRLILFHSEDGCSNDWEWLEGTEADAVREATCDRRHLNYGRNGYTIVNCPDRPRAVC